MKFSRVCNSKLLSIMISNQKTPKLRIYGWSSDLQIPCNCPGVDCWSALFQWGPGRGFDGAWTATRGRAFSWETVICSVRLSATEVSASTSVTSYRIRTALCKTSQIRYLLLNNNFQHEKMLTRQNLTWRVVAWAIFVIAIVYFYLDGLTKAQIEIVSNFRKR